MIKCIIFDCDGTLVDSELLFNRTLSLKLKELAIDLSTAELVNRFRGVQLTTVLTTLEAEYGVVLDDYFINSYRAALTLLFERELAPCAGVDQTLSQIDLAMCVASNGPLDKIQLALRVTDLAHYFGSNTFSAYDVNSWKPDPGLFLHAAQEMGFQPNECLVVEDSIVGIDAANSAGIPAVLYDPNEEHFEVTSVLKIDAFVKLLAHLSQ